MTETTDIKALRDSAECMASLLDNLAGYEPSDIYMDTVELRFEDEGGCDTGCDISIVGTAQQSADIIRALLDQLEAERQRADASESYARERDSENESIALTVGRLRTELAALRSTQEPYGYYSAETEQVLKQMGHANITNEPVGNWQFPLFTRQPKPIVVRPNLHPSHSYASVAVSSRDEQWCAAIEAAGVVVKDGE